MNKPLRQITCNRCNMSQTWTGQKDCKSCGVRLNNWSVSSQLAVQTRSERPITDRDYGDEDG